MLFIGKWKAGHQTGRKGVCRTRLSPTKSNSQVTSTSKLIKVVRSHSSKFMAVGLSSREASFDKSFLCLRALTAVLKPNRVVCLLVGIVFHVVNSPPAAGGTRSNSLSQLRHFIIVLVNSASFSSFSVWATRVMTSLSLPSMKTRARFTSSFSLFSAN